MGLQPVNNIEGTIKWPIYVGTISFRAWGLVATPNHGESSGKENERETAVSLFPSKAL